MTAPSGRFATSGLSAFRSCSVNGYGLGSLCCAIRRCSKNWPSLSERWFRLLRKKPVQREVSCECSLVSNRLNQMALSWIGSPWSGGSQTTGFTLNRTTERVVVRCEDWGPVLEDRALYFQQAYPARHRVR